MKKMISYCIIAIMAYSICGCQSREEKALATIRESMNKTLDDIKSYEPIETKIDSLKYDRYGDTLLVNVILRMKLAYSGDSRSPIPMISVHSVGDLLYRRQS